MLTTVNIILGVIAIIVFFVALKMLKNVFTAIASVMVFLIVCMLAFSVIIYIDAGQLQDSFSEDKLIMFNLEGEQRAGITVENGSSDALISRDSTIRHLKTEELSRYSTLVNEEDFENVTYGLILRVNLSALDFEFDVELGENNITLDNETFVDIMLAESIEEIDAILFERYGEVGSLVIYEDATEIKSIFASNAFLEDAGRSGSNYLLQLIRQGDLEMHPEFLTQTILRSLPEFLIPN